MLFSVLIPGRRAMVRRRAEGWDDFKGVFVVLRDVRVGKVARMGSSDERLGRCVDVRSRVWRLGNVKWGFVERVVRGLERRTRVWMIGRVVRGARVRRVLRLQEVRSRFRRVGKKRSDRGFGGLLRLLKARQRVCRFGKRLWVHRVRILLSVSWPGRRTTSLLLIEVGFG